MDPLTVEVDGHPLAYRRVGSGPALVLLHGAWSDGREWRGQWESLADAFTVIAWDAPGCGRSFDPPNHFPMAGYADALAGLVHALDVGQPHVLGLSFGGGLALEFYHRHPHLVQSLVLASAYAGWKGSLPPDEVAARVERAVAESQRPPAEWVGSYLPGFFANPVSPETSQELLDIMMDVRPAGTIPMVNAFAEADLRGVLNDIGVPTLLVYGERDRRAPRRVAEELHSGIRGSQLKVIPGVGHLVNLEAPQVFNAVVRDFLSQV